VSHFVLEQQIRDWGEAHSGTGVTVSGPLHGIGREHLGGVNRPAVKV
jgi:hypothetical protein